MARDVLPTEVSEDQNTQILFAPEAVFDEWWNAVESFRNPEPEKPVSGLQFSGQNLTFDEGRSFDRLCETVDDVGVLVLAENGNLEADIVVNSAFIDGVLRGNITATERVVVENHAVVIGDINTPRLTIRGGAIIEGDCYFEDSREREHPPVWAVLKGSLAKVWRGRLFH
ncbi:MAG TPA: polymer-forming cytoskeletal protein [Pyrinomonadaceae bacterium]|nr:polymer-forming cytoskeletal protein [Pyrinomonadaceae bacterium]